ncbi:STAS domain-containing protein [Mycolicibacterium baixiangningiae]|uniref:STAS domain-containing protein n=1 Tax=Mycolicibacterium baixiangningiae TaxID=2761578 RepID=UPI0018689B60|nr:STAS domain-containing protein [Mycolicibacterium baixiangningiae]
MTMSLTFETVRCDDGERILSAAGEIDMSNIDALKQALATATTEAGGGSGTLTVDFSAVEYLDSAAINVLFARADHIEKLIAHPLLMSTLRISGLAELVTVERGH